MKYFIHDIDDRNKVASKLIRKKFGAEGYGIYQALLEVIGEHVKPNNYEDWGHVEAMHDMTTLADECATTPEKLKLFLEFCNEKKIFEKHDGRLYCSLILERLDGYAAKIKKNSDKNGQKRTKTKKVRINRTEQNRTKQNKKNEGGNPLSPPNSASAVVDKNQNFNSKRNAALNKAKLLPIALLLFVSAFFLPATVEARKTLPIVRYTAEERTTARAIAIAFPERPVEMVAVAIGESGLNPKAKGHNCWYSPEGEILTQKTSPQDRSTWCRKTDLDKAWSVDCGLLQINVSGRECPAELLTVKGNLKNARAKYDVRGFSPWVAYTAGYYLKHMAKARELVISLLARK